MWTPTHIQITVNRARNLPCKGKSGTNDSYAVIQLGSDKYQTSIKERSTEPEWNEECEFAITDVKQSNVKVTLFHRNLLGLDKFLGFTELQLGEFPIYESPRPRWFPLSAKSGSKRPVKDRGDVEVTLTFIVLSLSQSQQSLNQSDRSSGGMRIGSSIKSLLTHTVGERLNMKWASRGSLSQKSASGSGTCSAQSMLDLSSYSNAAQLTEEAAPSLVSGSGVRSGGGVHGGLVRLEDDKDDGNDDELVNGSAPRRASDSQRSINDESPSKVTKQLRLNTSASSAVIVSSKGQLNIGEPVMFSCRPMQRPRVAAHDLHELHEYKRARELKLSEDNAVVVSVEMMEQFKDYEKDELIQLMLEQKSSCLAKDAYIRDLEDYIDDLLVKVIESQPKLLQNPYQRSGGGGGGGGSSSLPAHRSDPPNAAITKSSTQNFTLSTANTSPGIYITTTVGDTSDPAGGPQLTKAPTNKTSAGSGNTKPGGKPKHGLIISPFKRLQALIK